MKSSTHQYLCYTAFMNVLWSIYPHLKGSVKTAVHSIDASGTMVTVVTVYHPTEPHRSYQTNITMADTIGDLSFAAGRVYKGLFL